MRVQSDIKVEHPPSRPAESSGSTNALIHAACAGCLGAAAWAGARAIGIAPGLFTVGLGIGLGDEDDDSKTQAVALNAFLFFGLAMITGDWNGGATAIGSLVVGVFGGEGIAAIGGIDRIARKSIGGGIAAGAGSAMLVHWGSGSGGMPKTDPIFVGLMGSVIAWGVSREAAQGRFFGKIRPLTVVV